MSRLLGEGRPKPPSLLDTMSNSSMEYSIMATTGITASALYTKKKGVSPVDQLGDVRLANSTHKNSSIHLAPCFFKQS
jgi:hypothetical protein